MGLSLSTGIHRGPSGVFRDFEFTTPGNTQHIVPGDVWWESAVAVGGGGDGLALSANRGGGAGGGLCYRNDIRVHPGQVVPVVVSGTENNGFPASSQVLGLQANRGARGVTSGTAPGGTSSGGEINRTGGSCNRRTGGSAARYTANGVANGGTGIGLDGVSSTGPYGRGGNSSLFFPEDGAPGGVRIISGVGKSYPSNAV